VIGHDEEMARGTTQDHVAAGFVGYGTGSKTPGGKEEKHGQLSPREQAMLDGLAKGWTYKRPASELDISIDTIRANIRRIYESCTSSHAPKLSQNTCDFEDDRGGHGSLMMVKLGELFSTPTILEWLIVRLPQASLRTHNPCRESVPIPQFGMFTFIR